MSRLTRDGTAEPVSRDQILRHARGQGSVHFPCSADHEQDWQPYPVDPYSAICDDHTYIHTYIHGQLNREKFPCSRARLRIWFRETDLAVPFRVSLLILHTPAESGAYSRDCSRCSRWRPYILPHPLRYIKVSSKYEISVLQLLYCIGTYYACTRIKKKTRE